MILNYNPKEFTVNDIEIRKIVCSPYYNYDCLLYPTCDISEMEAYINGVQVDIEDESLISNNDWDIIIKRVCEEISDEDIQSHMNSSSKKINNSKLLEKLSKLLPDVYNLK